MLRSASRRLGRKSAKETAARRKEFTLSIFTSRTAPFIERCTFRIQVRKTMREQQRRAYRPAVTL